MWPFNIEKKKFKTIQIIEAKFEWTDHPLQNGEGNLIETFSYILQENEYGERKVIYDSYGTTKYTKKEKAHPLYHNLVLPWLHHLEEIEEPEEKR